MENFGDWFYILILIVAGVGSIISSFGKKQREAAEEKTPPREIIVSDGYDDENHSPIPGRTQPQPRPQPFSRPQTNVAAATAASPFEPSYKSKKYRGYLQQQSEGISAFIQRQSDNIMPDNPEESAIITLEDLPADIDEWRKAFVYSEILNRKY
jgi:hypothetical protein